MANQNLTKEVCEALASISDMIHVETDASGKNAVAIGLMSVDLEKFVCFNTNTWDSESMLDLVSAYIEYLTGNWTWHGLCTYDDSASKSKHLQMANDRGDLQKQVRTYVKTEIGKRSKEIHELDKSMDLVKMLYDYDFNIDLIKVNLINKYSDSTDFLKKQVASFDLDLAKAKGGIRQVDASHIITKLNEDKINKLVERLSKTKREIQGV